jgi:hypothetical protein
MSLTLGPSRPGNLRHLALSVPALLLTCALAAAGCGGSPAAPDGPTGGQDSRPDAGPGPDDSFPGPDGPLPDGPAPDTAVDAGPVTLGVRPECNPLGTLDTCMLPYPSNVYLQADTGTTTGYRVALPQEAMPVAVTGGGPVLVAPYNRHDGFSPATPIVAYLTDAAGNNLDGTGLPPHSDPGVSLTAASATVLYDMDHHQRVAHFAEVDAQPPGRGAHVIYIWPMQRLQPGTRYAVAITTAAKTTGGDAQRPAGFQAILDGAPVTDSPRLDAVRPAIEEVISTLGSQENIAASDLLLAWDFRTSSEDRLSGQMIDMRDAGLAAIDPSQLGGQPTYTITGTEEAPNASTYRIIRGTFKAPLFLTMDGQPGGLLARDENDKPALQGTWDVNFVAVLPTSAATTALPLFQVGHGIFGSAEQITDANLVGFADQLGFAMIATDLIGVADPDKALLLADIQDLNKLPQVTERMQQGVLNQLALSRVITTGLLSDPVFQVSDTQPALTNVLRYVGVSVGGIMGGSFLGYAQDIDKAVIGVPGGPWSLMIPRSLVGNAFRPLLGAAYTKPLERQLILAFIQNHFDPADPVTAAPHVLDNPLPDTPAKKILMALSVGDALVPNLAGAYLARTLGLTMLTPSPTMFYGIDGHDAPLDSALSVWTINPMPVPPETDTSLTMDNNAHVGIFLLPKLWAQLTTFLMDGGEVTQTCDGPCDPQ